MQGLFTEEQVKLFELVVDSAAWQKTDVYVVGGTVRDIYIGNRPKDRDIDLIVNGNAIEFSKNCLNKLPGELKIFPDFFTAKIINPSGFTTISEVDFASSRTEAYLKGGSLPQVSLADISQDLSRRDFTINAMAVSLTGLLRWLKSSEDVLQLREATLDPFSGYDDINKKLVRILHSKSFIDDPTRIFRACRYAIRIEGALEEQTAEILSQALSAGCFETISNVRKFNELRKVFEEERAAAVLNLMKKLGLFNYINIIDRTCLDDFINTLERLDNIKIDRSLKSGISQRILYLKHLCLGQSEDQLIKKFIEFGIGKKQIRVYQTDVSVYRHSSPSFDILSNESLLLLYSVRPEITNDLMPEIKKRKLI